MATLDDKALVSRAAAGDSAAFGELVEAYQTRIYNYAYRIAGNPEDAKDVAQEAFLRVFKVLPDKGDSLDFAPYLYRTAHNIACDLVGTRKRFAGPDALDLEYEPSLRADPERVALVKDQQTRAHQAAFELPEKHRAVLALREVEELSYQEIADVLDMPRNTVGVYLSRARLQFKEAFRMAAVDVDKLAEECRDMLPLLSAYMDEELDGTERTRVDAHLEECPLCRLALEEMTESSKSYRALIPLLPPADLAEAVMRDLEKLRTLDKTRVDDGTDGSLGQNAQAGEPEQHAPTEAPAPATAPTAARRRLPLKTGHWLLIALAVVLAGAMAAGGALLPFDPAEGPSGRTVREPSTPISLVPTSATDASGPVKPDVDIERVDEPDLPTEGEGTPIEPPVSDTEAPATPAQRSPADGATSVTATVTLVWGAVSDPSGVTYVVEIESFNGKSFVPLTMVEDIADTSLVHVMSSFRQRWRVYAVDGAGNVSEPSSWREFSRIILLIPPLEGYEPPTLY